ncbi:hypothetical protein [Algivirga pacifica]|uniref:Transposase n=1 Tax=Algivirga pacifica TaxID=1162670 RepID=A0ABP9DPW4_9BACT
MQITEEQILSCNSIEEFRAITLALFKELNRLKAENIALRLENEALKAENEALKAENMALRAIMGKDSSTSSKPTSKNPYYKKKR